MTKKRRKKEAVPSPFQWRPVDAALADDATVEKLVREFIHHFVERSRRERAELYLLNRSKRARGLCDLWKWLEPDATEELGGAVGFPQHLDEGFPGVRGVLLDYKGRALRVTAAEAAILGEDISLFIANDGQMALLFAERGPPMLIEARRG